MNANSRESKNKPGIFELYVISRMKNFVKNCIHIEYLNLAK